MSIKKIFTEFVNAIKDPERDITERAFLLMTLLAEIAVFIALAGDLIMGEDIKEIITLFGVLTFVPAVTLICLHFNRLRFAIGSIALGLIVVVIPAIYFFSGGLSGGGVFWVIFSFLYLGIVVSSKWRKYLFTLLFFVVLGCFLVSYYHPGLLTVHSVKKMYIDAFISLILVGMECFLMTWFMGLLLKDESLRAREEAKKAEELSRAQNRFFSSMSHEIRTPINSILGLNELILRDQGASDEIVKDATGIQGAGKLLLALINDILDFSKMEAGSMEIVPVDYRVGDMISEIVNMIWVKANDKGLKFEVSIDPNVPSVLYGDEVRIKQVIINLLNNAVKYTPEGTIYLHIEGEAAGEKTIGLSISVTDTGMGIKKEALPDLFSAFKRVDEEKNRNIEGTGLGLSIVKQLVDLMGGDISVNSVYGEGSTFTVTIKQGISDPTLVGELNIHNVTTAKRNKYESSFRAPEAKVLIVDDNDMNLEVEKRLLADTGIEVDTAISGRAALELTLEKRYDVIFMDHLMPKMDGIECLEKIRSQSGGMNRITPVVVLTANAGSDNRDLYTRSGFDGYLVKPVSGENLEDSLLRLIPKDKLILRSRMLRMREDINTASRYAKKQPVIITATSMCDLPVSVTKELGIPVIPFLIHTKEGVFKDGVQMDANELVRYINSGGNAVSSPPDVKAYTDFFAKALRRAHHLIHIALTTSMSEDYVIASEAAKAFDNVTVINSECLSSSSGLLALIGYRLAEQGVPVNDIVTELETVKKRLSCSFVINTTEYMAKKELIKPWVHKAASSLNAHPALRIRDDRATISSISFGSIKRAYRKYIHDAFSGDVIPDAEVLFITYVDVPGETLEWIREEVSKLVYFENVVFQQASPAISSNCGPGSIGLLYFVKSNKSYNLGAFFSVKDEREDVKEEEDNLPKASEPKEIPYDDDASGDEWYRSISFIDADEAIKNSGSEEAFRSVLQIFYDSIPVKSKELSDFFDSENWDNYTIKIHALKSSAKLIGAVKLSEKAALLEAAGKEGDYDYIRSNHRPFMAEYKKAGVELKATLPGAAESVYFDPEKPVADEAIMSSVFDGLLEAAEAMDYDSIESILKELEEYSVPEADRSLMAEIVKKAEAFDYDGMAEAIKNSGNL